MDVPTQWVYRPYEAISHSSVCTWDAPVWSLGCGVRSHPSGEGQKKASKTVPSLINQQIQDNIAFLKGLRDTGAGFQSGLHCPPAHLLTISRDPGEWTWATSVSRGPATAAMSRWC
jgi:hypothetical protein